MTGPTTPAPGLPEPRLADLVRAFQRNVRAFGGLDSVLADVRRRAEAVERVRREHEERPGARWRVRRMMPTLTVRQVLVHGYAQREEA